MHKKRTPLMIWFWAIHLVASDKRGISAVYLSQQFGITYPTAWLLLHKIRKAMTDRDNGYTLAGIVEMDDFFIGAPTEGGKRGRGTEKTKNIAGLSLNKPGHPLYLKMQVINNLKSSTVLQVADHLIAKGTTIYTDLYSSYCGLNKEGYTHMAEEFNHTDNPDHQKWLHTIISNAKAVIGGTYHGLEKKHLQPYLGEFCYRFNRRKFPRQLFNCLLAACASTDTVTYDELVGVPT